jgi:type IV secretory pathway TrbF-like protein
MNVTAPVSHPTVSLDPDRKTQATMFSARLAYSKAAVRALSIVTAAITVTLVAVLCWTYGVYRASLVRDVRFFAIDSAGGLSPVNPDALKFHPTDQILRSFLMRFVKQHSERISVSVTQDYRHSLLFMDRRLTTPTNLADDIHQIRELQEGRGQEIRIHVSNVSIQITRYNCADVDTPQPCLATVQYEKEYYDRYSGFQAETRKFSAAIQFVIKEQITNDMVEDNPIGLVITRYHEDEGWL